MRRTLFIVAVSFLGLTPVVAPAGPTVHALRIDQPPQIDGALEDRCWREAEPLTNFTQVLPVEAAQPSERTEVRFVYTRDVLFIGIRCFDRHPEKILVKTMQRDNTFDSDDYVKIAFDTFGKGRDGYVFMVNAAGARTDSIFGKFSEEDRNYDAIWDARARVDAQGWTAEIALPFKSISFDVKNDFWRMNIERVIRHKQETVRWSAISRAKQVTA
ncbi:MAG TPA: carbohydrate binding family 9 domain-containing protein, partial [Chthoniobacterales bacterium]|nr:carbohydrate binding family 9 domain-containing protein [Chthoniobacterales bacterium]